MNTTYELAYNYLKHVEGDFSFQYYVDCEKIWFFRDTNFHPNIVDNDRITIVYNYDIYNSIEIYNNGNEIISNIDKGPLPKTILDDLLIKSI
jgi:hypothetical protein